MEELVWYIEWNSEMRQWCVKMGGFIAFHDPVLYFVQEERKRLISIDEREQNETIHRGHG